MPRYIHEYNWLPASCAYRRLAKQFHPDRNPAEPGAEENFKEVQWAYEKVLNLRETQEFESTAAGGDLRMKSKLRSL